MGDGKGYRIYFVSGSTSTTPITASTEGYIASTNANVSVGNLGAVNWNIDYNTENSFILNWHAYMCSNSTWSDKSDVYNFTLADRKKNKIIMPYRNGNNSIDQDICYVICSGNTVGNPRVLYEGVSTDPTLGTRAVYGRTLKDFKSRIWIEGLFAHNNAVPSDPPNYYSPIFLYTYPGSCNSWQGGYDYWFSPCNKIIGSSSATRIQRSDGAEYLTFTVCSSCNAGPKKNLIGVPDIEGQPSIFNIMPNGELLVCLAVDPAQPDIYYMSSNEAPSGTWHLSLSLPSPTYGRGSSYSMALAATLNNTMFFYTSGGYLVGRLSTDCARTWGEPQKIESLAQPTFQYIQLDTVSNDRFVLDDYARLFVLRLSGSSSSQYQAISGTQYIYKINTNNVSDYSFVETSHSSMSYTQYLGGGGNYRSGLTVFQYPIGIGNTLGGDGFVPGGNPGDPRFVHYWNENTGEYGHTKFNDTTPVGFTWGSHVGGAARLDNSGRLVCIGSAYFGVDGTTVYKGTIINPDLCSGASVTTIGVVINDPVSVAGGCCHGFEILE